MAPTSQALAAWMLVLSIWLILTAGAIAVVDPGLDTAVVGLALLALVSALAVFRPFVAARVPAAPPRRPGRRDRPRAGGDHRRPGAGVDARDGRGDHGARARDRGAAAVRS